jgi:shikimate dehydrogenase
MAKAVVAALRDRGFAQGTIVARNEVAGGALAAQYGYTWRADLPEDGAPLLVNVTPLGMEGRCRCVGLSRAMIEDCAIAFDVVAQPAQTPFIIAAEQAGKAIISGAEVIVLQAIEQLNSTPASARRPNW